jgi:predicted CoA-binding protein
MMSKNEQLAKILTNFCNVAVVGISEDMSKPSHEVALYLQRAGYRIIPVNPKYTSVLNEICYPSLTDIPDRVEIVVIFRRVNFISDIVEEAISIKARVIWMQMGLRHESAARRAQKAGLQVVMNRCMKIEHRRLPN